MDRRRFLLTSLAGVVAAPCAAGAQQERKIVGFLVTDARLLTRQGVGKALSQGGYVEGPNLLIETRVADVEGKLAHYAAELVRLKPTVILAEGPGALKATAHATKGIPIVAFDMESDPVQAGFIASLSRPGGNITGVFLDAPELIGKWFGILKETIPRLSRMAALWDPATGRAQMTAASSAARSLGMQLETVEVQGTGDFNRAFSAIVQVRPNALLLLSSPVIALNSPTIAAFALRQRLPGVSMFRGFARSGGLLAYGPNIDDLHARCGEYVIRILNGAKPSELPIQRPTTFRMVINLKTAKTLGLTIPPSLLARADQVIE